MYALGLALVLLTLTTLPAAAATYYVSPSGNDSAVGSRSAPFRTVQRGIKALKASDTLILRAGTYAEGDLTPPSGVAGAPTTIRAEAGERPILQPNNRAIDTIILFLADRSHITIDGLILDGGSPSGERVTQFPVATQRGTSHLALLNSEVRRSRGTCVHVQGSHWTIRNNHIHHCGLDPKYDHGIYFAGDQSVIANNRFDHNSAYDIQNYPRGEANTYDSNVFTASGGGVTLPTGSHHRFVNNLIYDTALRLTRGEHGVQGFGPNTVVEGNILVNNGLVTINENDRGGVIRGNTLCNGRIQAVHAEVKDNRYTCEGIDVERLARERTSATPTLGPTRAPLPAPKNLRIRPVP